MRSFLYATLCLALPTVLACSPATDEGAGGTDGETDTFLSGGKADAYGISEGSYEAAAILEVASTYSEAQLRGRAGVAARTAREIARAQTRLGRAFISLAELDAVPYTGARFFTRMIAFVEAEGLVGVCGDGVIQPAVETCDHGGAPSDACGATCRSAHRQGPGEAYLKSIAPMVYDQFGSHVSISEDGSLVAVGAPCKNPTRSANEHTGPCHGGIEIYARTGSAWSHEAMLVPPAPFDNTAYDTFFGARMALSPDGQLLAVAQSSQRTSAGSRGGVFLFDRRPDATWAYRTLLVGDAGQAVDAVGELAFSGDGRTLAVTESGAVGSGEVRVLIYRRGAGEAWTLFGSATPWDDAADIGFGKSLALSHDGSVMVVGAPQKMVETSRGLRWRGAAFVFERFGDDYVETQQIDGPVARPELQYNFEFGAGVAVSGDGDVVAISAPGAFGSSEIRSGEVAVFRRDAAGWWRAEGTLDQPRVTQSGAFGAGLALSRDGRVLLAGEPDESELHVYGYVDGGWRHRAVVPAPGGFGASVAVSAHGTRAVVGAPREGAAATGVDGLVDEATSLGKSGAAWVLGAEDLATP